MVRQSACTHNNASYQFVVILFCGFSCVRYQVVCFVAYSATVTSVVMLFCGFLKALFNAHFKAKMYFVLNYLIFYFKFWKNYIILPKIWDIRNVIRSFYMLVHRCSTAVRFLLWYFTFFTYLPVYMAN